MRERPLFGMGRLKEAIHSRQEGSNIDKKQKQQQTCFLVVVPTPPHLWGLTRPSRWTPPSRWRTAEGLFPKVDFEWFVLGLLCFKEGFEAMVSAKPIFDVEKS